MTEHYQIPFLESIPLLFLQNNIFVIVQLLTHVYTLLLFIIVSDENWNTEVLHFQLPLGLLCQTKLCHIFLTIILSSSIPWIVMMYAPFGMMSKIFSYIPLIYVQTCYTHSILHISYSFYCNQ